MRVTTDQDAFDGQEIRYAERDIKGNFGFHSAVHFELNKMLECDLAELTPNHPEIHEFRDLPGPWRFSRLGAQWKPLDLIGAIT
jgi:hypothetical protein